MDLLYIVGEPGAGKSTLMREIYKGWGYQMVAKPFLYTEFANGVIMLGGIRDGYPGTDMLGLDASPRVVEWLQEYHPPLVMGEGARLGTAKFLISAQSLGYDIHLVRMVSAGEARARRNARPDPQRASFVKGQVTKSADVAAEFHALDISPTMPPEFLVRILKDPVTMAFRR